MDIKKKIKKSVENTFEQVKHESAEVIKQNFTLLSREILMSVFGKETHDAPKNFTPFDANVRAKMGENFAAQDSSDLDAVRKQLEGHQKEGAEDPNKAQLERRQFDFVKQEVADAIQKIREEEQERKNKEWEEEQEKKNEEAQKRQGSMSLEEPSSKQKRGQFGAKRKKAAPQITVENKASQGKQ